MRVTGWRGASVEKKYRNYGVRIGTVNRRAFFGDDKEQWRTVTIEIESDGVIEAELTPGFWCDCPEIRHRAFRDWFESHGLISWGNGTPPEFELLPLGEKGTRHFRLSRLTKVNVYDGVREFLNHLCGLPTDARHITPYSRLPFVDRGRVGLDGLMFLRLAPGIDLSCMRITHGEVDFQL